MNERPAAASNPPTDPRIHFCRHALRERSIASAAGGARADGRTDGGKRGREGSRIKGGREAGCVEDERLSPPTLEQPNIGITAPTVTERAGAGGRWSEPFLKAVVADHRSFPDGSRIALLSPPFFLPAALTLEKEGMEVGGVRLGDLVNEIGNKPLITQRALSGR